MYQAQGAWYDTFTSGLKTTSDVYQQYKSVKAAEKAQQQQSAMGPARGNGGSWIQDNAMYIVGGLAVVGVVLFARRRRRSS